MFASSVVIRKSAEHSVRESLAVFTDKKLQVSVCSIPEAFRQVRRIDVYKTAMSRPFIRTGSVRTLSTCSQGFYSVVTGLFEVAG